MLHKAIQKNRVELKPEIVQTLLDRGANVASRDSEGSTPRDYVTIYGIEKGAEILQIIDNHVIDLASNDQVCIIKIRQH